MADWKRIVVGNAFRLPSSDFNYYRDLLLVWPFLIFSIAAVAHFPIGADSVAERNLGIKLIVLAIACIAFAKERLALLTGIAAFLALRCLFALATVKRDWVVVIGFFSFAGLALLGAKIRGSRPPAYELHSRLTVADLVIGVASMGGTMALVSWMTP